MSFTIDVSDFMEFAGDCERAIQRAPAVFADAAFEIGTLVQQKAQLNAMPHRKSGSMENSITPARVSSGPAMARAEVAVTAVSDRGFPYPIVVDTGSRYYTGSRWFSRAVDDTKASGDVEATVNDAVELLLNEMRG